MKGSGQQKPSNGGIGVGVSASTLMQMNESQNEGASQSRSSASSGRPVRELKVEDALLYLDQVKMEFGDKPEIYNEFGYNEEFQGSSN